MFQLDRDVVTCGLRDRSRPEGGARLARGRARGVRRAGVARRRGGGGRPGARVEKRCARYRRWVSDLYEQVSYVYKLINVGTLLSRP